MLGLVDPVSGWCDRVWYHVKCLGHYTSVRQLYKSEHWAPCHHQTPSWYYWKIVESDVKPEQTNLPSLDSHNSVWKLDERDYYSQIPHHQVIGVSLKFWKSFTVKILFQVLKSATCLDILTNWMSCQRYINPVRCSTRNISIYELHNFFSILFYRDSLEILMETFYKEVEKVTDLVLKVCKRLLIYIWRTREWFIWIFLALIWGRMWTPFPITK